MATVNLYINTPIAMDESVPVDNAAALQPNTDLLKYQFAQLDRSWDTIWAAVEYTAVEYEEYLHLDATARAALDGLAPAGDLSRYGHTAGVIDIRNQAGAKDLAEVVDNVIEFYMFKQVTNSGIATHDIESDLTSTGSGIVDAIASGRTNGTYKFLDASATWASLISNASAYPGSSSHDLGYDHATLESMVESLGSEGHLKHTGAGVSEPLVSSQIFNSIDLKMHVTYQVNITILDSDEDDNSGNSIINPKTFPMDNGNQDAADQSGMTQAGLEGVMRFRVCYSLDNSQQPTPPAAEEQVSNEDIQQVADDLEDAAEDTDDED